MSETVKVEIRNRWTGSVQFACEVDAALSIGLRLGFAIKTAFKARAVLTGAVLTGAVLTDAVLTHADLTRAVLTHADLTRAVLTRADLTRAVLRGAVLTHADLRGADLTGADLTDADLTRADLTDADLTGADLTRAVLTHAPKIENIHQAVYSAASQPDALDMRDWHTCDTTHCRGGWVVHLAGSEGRELESKMGTAGAAALIYLASDPKLGRMPDFYCSNTEALADMKARAEAEAALSKAEGK